MDAPEPLLIGEEYYSLEAVSNLIDNLTTCNLIGSTFEIHGKLKLNIIPFNPDGSKDPAFFPDEPNDVKYEKLDFIV